MILLLFLLFFTVAAVAFLEDRLSPVARWGFFGIAALFMAFLAGFRPDDFDHDYANYVVLYNNSFAITTEVSFILIASFVQFLFDDVLVLFLIYACIALLLHACAIRKLTDLWLFSLLMYIGTYYLLHGMNQIRAAVAAGFFLLALPYLQDGSRRKYLFWVLCATLFHYSAVVLFFLLFFDNCPLKKWQYWFYGLIPPVCYVAYFLHIDVFVMLPIPYFEEKMEAYQMLQEQGGAEWSEINVFNMVLLVKILITYFLLWKIRLVASFNSYVYILIKVEVLAIASLVLFAGIPVVAFRINELLGIVEVILFPLIYYTVKPSWVGKAVVFVVACAFLLISVYYNHVVIV